MLLTSAPQQQSQLLTTTQSTAVMKNCVRLALSTVSFARGLFPDEAFAPKSYAGVNIMVLNPMSANGAVLNEDSLRLQQWLEKGAFPALDLGYLDRILFSVLDDHPSSPTAHTMENYSFKVSYMSDSQAKLKFDISQTTGQQGARACTTKTVEAPGSDARAGVSREEVNKMMQHMIKQLVVLTSALKPLPARRWLSMSLVYNATAPKGYAPTGFCEADFSVLPHFAGDPLSVNVGEVRTDQHAIAIKLQQLDDDPASAKFEDMPTQCVSNHDDDGRGRRPQQPDDGEDKASEADTNAGWASHKHALFERAVAVVQRSPQLDPGSALRQSALANELSPDVLRDFELRLRMRQGESQGSYQTEEDPAVSKRRKIAKCKRPFQQVAAEAASEHVQPAKHVAPTSRAPPTPAKPWSSGPGLPQPPPRNKLVQTYARRRR